MDDALRILVVEDDDQKYGVVIQKIADELDSLDHKFTRAKDYETAFHKLLTEQFEIVILDLFIPQTGMKPSANGSEALIRLMLGGEVHSPPQIIGLTQHGDKISTDGKIFGDSMLLLEEFDLTTDAWAIKIARKIKYVSKTLKAASVYSAKKYASDVVILVAKYDTEFEPINKKLKWIGDPLSTHPLFPDEIIRIGNVDFGKGQNRRVIIFCLNEMGIASAASISVKLSMIFKPRIFTMLGMCCGFSVGISPSKLNDVIVVEECACWDEGKYQDDYFGPEDGFKFRPRSLKCSSGMHSLTKKLLATDGQKWARAVSKSRSHKKLLETSELKGSVRDIPRIISGKILSGLSVVSDTEKVDLILHRAPSALGLEMEIFGVYSALTSLKVQPIEFVAIKGVADFGINKDPKIFDPVQPIASTSALSVFMEIAKSYFHSISRQ